MLNEQDEPGGMGNRWPRSGEMRSVWEMAKLLKALDLCGAGENSRVAWDQYTFIMQQTKGLDAESLGLIREALYSMALCCRQMDEPTIADLLTEAMTADGTPPTPADVEAWDVLAHAFFKALTDKKLYYVERDRSRFLDDGEFVTSFVRRAFPGATSELIQAGKAFCFDLHDGAVFHCMRAVEIGARALAVELKCEFQHPLDQTDLHPLLEQCELRINKMKQLPKSQTKAEDLEFYSMAASNFRYFKDGWRIRAIHGRASFQQMDAERILTRSLEFFEVISKRLKE